jgi:Phosphate-selective porin O and P
MRRYVLAMALAVLTAHSPLGLEAQTEISARGATLRIGGRLHGQYWSSFVDNAGSAFFIRRARLNVDMTFTDFVTGKVLTDFTGGRATLLDAYVRLNFDERFRITFGQFKRAFDLFELSSSTDLSLVERTGAVVGYDDCSGVGRLCSYSRLSERLLLSGRDAGIKFDGSFGRLSYQATITNGTPPTIPDVNGSRSFAGRVSFSATGDVRVSANATLKDYLDPDDETAYAFAWGGDVQVGTWRDGFLLQAGVIGGENWESLDPAYVAGNFLTGQVVASYYLPLEGERIIGIEPIGRISVADPDDTIDRDAGTLLTPGVMFYFLGKSKFGINYDYYVPRGGGAVSTLRLATFLYF